VFCTEDLQLIKGTSRVRRRFLDLLLAQTHPPYLPLLQRYAQALRARNAVLKQPSTDRATLASFTPELIKLGQEIGACRRALIPRISPLVQAAYHQVAPQTEEVRLEYQPSVKADFATELAQSQAWERRQRSTVIGPHRDELALLLNDQPAAQFASEGQKRTLAVSLKMAQAEFLTELHGTPPVLLIDDVMGELDARRRAGLMPLLETAHRSRGQVFMTCTEENWPRELGRSVMRWEVNAGRVLRI
jgi:DNA replication and repair protein RecF